MAKQPAAYPFPYSKAAQLDSRINIARPVIDQTLAPIVDAYPLPEELDLDFMHGVTAKEDNEAFVCTNAQSIIKSVPHLKHTEHFIPGCGGNRIVLSVIAPQAPTSATLPALYRIHGGGMIAGDRFAGLTELLDLLKCIECVEYRLAPENRAPGPADDCYAGLVWMSEKATSLGIDPAGIVVWGVPSGAALAAVLCLMVRDRKAPAIPIKAQMFISPMLDDRCQSVSDRQFEYGSPWCGVSDCMAWAHVTGEGRGSDEVSLYQAPSRAKDLSDLPPAYIDTAECEVFRDHAVLYAPKMLRCGSTCELHIWPDAFHLFDGVDNLDVPLIHAAIEARQTWVRRMMQPIGIDGDSNLLL
ncbi:Alpha/Beta hydrolase protein [Aspergillus cavernicola]|uniref:Alpha/Beta hydrolase protein n=1 Tax=Aspergillus cavernicola TaxID=176166 RepID=A0ABR4HY07_9EURO